MNASVPQTRKRLGHILLGLAMVVFFPFVLLGALVPSNEYQAIGIDGAVDCDGPLGTVLLAIPPLIVYLAGFISFLRLARSSRRIGSIIVVVFAALVCVALFVNMRATCKTPRPDQITLSWLP